MEEFCLFGLQILKSTNSWSKPRFPKSRPTCGVKTDGSGNRQNTMEVIDLCSPISHAMTSILSDPNTKCFLPSLPSTIIVGAPNACKIRRIMV